ncbi:MAG: A/G-specific adenine glycosylase [Aliishimia sp.]
MRDQTKSRDILDWYDVHARVMPWRTSPQDRKTGIVPNPYHIWLSEVMLQQTTVAAVKEYFRKFVSLWPSVDHLAAAQDADVMAAWAGLGYYARARNLLKCARVISDELNGQFPRTQEELQKLPGIGPYTSAAIASIAFDQPATVLDGNVERVMSRLYNDATPLPAAKPVFYAYAEGLTPKKRAGDHAQAVMDLGATICTPRNPACGICPWRMPCQARIAGTAVELPKKTPKKAKPVRQGIAYVARRPDGAWLLETRPDKGLLGGMLGWPGSDWSEAPTPAPPFEGKWRHLPGDVRHTFTHFHLILQIQTAWLPTDVSPQTGEFVPAAVFRPSDLPTVMRKVFDLAGSEMIL